jgi:hypothetical protein
MEVGDQIIYLVKITLCGGISVMDFISNGASVAFFSFTLTLAIQLFYLIHDLVTYQGTELSGLLIPEM